MQVTIVAAMAENGVIGDGQRLPWRLPVDLKRFRETTWGHPIIMGRRTFESIGRPLPGRANIVLSARNADFRPEGCEVANSLEEALKIAESEAEGREIMVVGGGEVYRQAIPLCRRIHLTRIEGEFAGSVEFPDDFARSGDWRVVHEESYPSDPKNPHKHDFFLLERAENAPPSARVLTDDERERGFRR